MNGRIVLTAASVVWVMAATPAKAAQSYDFDIPAGSLRQSLMAFAAQARISVDVSDPRLSAVRVPALRGRYTIRVGLERLLQNTPYRFTIGRGNVVKLARRPLRPVPRRPTPPPLPPAPDQPDPPPQPIIVTASKQNLGVGDYPGSIEGAGFSVEDSLRLGSRSTSVLLRDLPNLASTDLGSGRNKIFVRGIADSSFNGQSQATVSQYFGESRLTYSAPDPDLALYDVKRVEVVEGPQGTLYGAGSLGGVIRIVPNVPEIGVTQLSSAAALNVTGGQFGSDGAIIANVGLGSGAAARVVGYRIVRPGYIDDPGRGLTDINRTKVTGLRADLRFKPSVHWTIDIGALGQDTASRDGQYTDGPLPERLIRIAAIAQPFDNDYRMVFATAEGDLGFARLVSNTSFTHHQIDTVFDATKPTDSVPIRFAEDSRVSLLTHETRLSGSAGSLTSWVAGVSLARSVNHVDRRLGPVGSESTISATRAEIVDSALFGEATMSIWRNVSLTAGGRLSYVSQIDQFAVVSGEPDFEPSRSQLHVLPSGALSWRPRRGVIAYLRYQEGFRPGAQQITGSVALPEVTRFRPDELRTTEIGIRFGTERGASLSGGAAYSDSRWNRVQADLITVDGFPYVANLGSASVRYMSANLIWKPDPQLTVEASGFLAASHLDRPEPGFVSSRKADLPNIADSGWRLTGRFQPEIGDAQLTLDGTIGYIGTSYLGISAPFDLRQGDYIDTALGARLDFGRWGLSVDVDNILDSRANRFSFGNPFSVEQGNQRTPLRPRSVRIGIDATF